MSIKISISSGFRNNAVPKASKTKATWLVTGDDEKIVILRPELSENSIPRANISEATRQLVRRIRILFQQSLLKPRQDWDKACLLIAADPNVTLERYACAFFHGIEVHGRQRFQFFMPQSQEISENEMWIVSLITQLQAADFANARYLTALRIEQPGRRRLLFIAAGLVRGLISN